MLSQLSYDPVPANRILQLPLLSTMLAPRREFAIMPVMPKHVLIDGNNLLHAMHEHAPIPNVGRETLVKIIERWACCTEDEVTIVFDGPVPREGLAKQMASGRITVRFSAPDTADDVIVAEIKTALHPTHIRIVTADKAIRREARHRRSQDTDSASFVQELFRQASDTHEPMVIENPTCEKPEAPSRKESDDWLEMFGYDSDAKRPCDGSDAANQ